MSTIQSTVKETLDVAERQVRDGLKAAEQTTATAASRIADRVKPLLLPQATPIVERVPEPERVVGKAYGLANDILSANRRYVDDVSRALTKLTGRRRKPAKPRTRSTATSRRSTAARSSKPRTKAS